MLDKAAELLGLSQNDYVTLKYHERSLRVSLPIRMDNGDVRVFEGFRVQHSSCLLYTSNRSAKLRTAFSQARVRFKNRKEYKYFRCPKCHAWLKLKRGSGEGTLTCGKCKHAFKAKA